MGQEMPIPVVYTMLSTVPHIPVYMTSDTTKATLDAIQDVKCLFDANPFWIYRENDLLWLLAAAITTRLQSKELPWISKVAPQVHREYPTRSVPSYAKGNGRHGIVDIVVLGKIDAAKGLSAVLQRDYDAIPSPLVVIEVGLDEGHKHIIQDLEKLTDWVSDPDSETGFLCHFFRNPAVPRGQVHATLLREAEKYDGIETSIPVNETSLLLAIMTKRVR